VPKCIRVSVADVCFIAKETGAQVTIAHVSHPNIVRIVQQAKENGANVLTEICPQYLYLEENTLAERGSFGKFTPPSRSAGESQELMKLVSEGGLDILASDHAPSTKQHKSAGSIWTSPFGLPGIDTTGVVMLTAVNKHILSLKRYVQMYSENPAKALGLYPKKGCIRVGSDADLVLIDMRKQWTITEDSIYSKAKWSPFSGFECIGKPVMTLLRGQIIMKTRGWKICGSCVRTYTNFRGTIKHDKQNISNRSWKYWYNNRFYARYEKVRRYRFTGYTIQRKPDERESFGYNGSEPFDPFQRSGNGYFKL